MEIEENQKTKVRLKQLVRYNEVHTNLPEESFVKRSNSWPEGSRVASLEDIR